MKRSGYIARSQYDIGPAMQLLEALHFCIKIVLLHRQLQEHGYKLALQPTGVYIVWLDILGQCTEWSFNFFPEIALNSHQISIQFKYCKMSEFETSHHLNFLFYYKMKCKFQFEIESLSGQKPQEFSAQNGKMGCFEVKYTDFVGHFYFETANLGREYPVQVLATFSISN